MSLGVSFLSSSRLYFCHRTGRAACFLLCFHSATIFVSCVRVASVNSRSGKQRHGGVIVRSSKHSGCAWLLPTSGGPHPAAKSRRQSTFTIPLLNTGRTLPYSCTPLQAHRVLRFSAFGLAALDVGPHTHLGSWLPNCRGMVRYKGLDAVVPLRSKCTS